MAKKIEKAIILLNTKNTDILKLKKKYERIYTGSFFCENIMPDLKEIETLFKKGIKNISIQTSFLTNNNIKRIKIELSEILYNFDNVEILINDLGLLDFLNNNYPDVKKGIGIPLSYDFMRMDISSLNSFMMRNRLYIIETDEDYLVDNIKKRDFLLSFRSTLKFVGVSRFCPWTRKIIGKCNFECKKYVKELRIKGNDKKMILWENAYFSKREKKSVRNFDRHVNICL